MAASPESRFRALLWASAVLVALTVVWIRSSWGGAYGTLLFVDAVSLAAPLAATAACLYRAGRESGRSQFGWRLLGYACLSWAAGMAFWAYEELWVQRGVPAALREPPFPSLADAGFLGLIPLAALGLALLAKGMFRLRSRLRLLHDGALVALGLLVVSWIGVLEPTYSANVGSVSRFELSILLAYPVADLLLMGTAVSAALFSPTEERTGIRLLLAGLAVLAVADTWFLFIILREEVTIPVVDVGWPAGFLLMALAALRPNRTTSSIEADAAPFLEKIPLVLAGLGLVLAGLTWARRPEGLFLPVVGVILLGLVGLRLVGMRQEMRRVAEVRRAQPGADE